MSIHGLTDVCVSTYKNWFKNDNTTVKKIPSVQTRKVMVGKEGSSLLETIAATSGMGEFSSSLRTTDERSMSCFSSTYSFSARYSCFCSAVMMSEEGGKEGGVGGRRGEVAGQCGTKGNIEWGDGCLLCKVK